MGWIWDFNGIEWDEYGIFNGMERNFMGWKQGISWIAYPPVPSQCWGNPRTKWRFIDSWENPRTICVIFQQAQFWITGGFFGFQEGCWTFLVHWHPYTCSYSMHRLQKCGPSKFPFPTIWMETVKWIFMSHSGHGEVESNHVQTRLMCSNLCGKYYCLYVCSMVPPSQSPWFLYGYLTVPKVGSRMDNIHTCI